MNIRHRGCFMGLTGEACGWSYCVSADVRTAGWFLGLRNRWPCAEEHNCTDSSRGNAQESFPGASLFCPRGLLGSEQYPLNTRIPSRTQVPEFLWTLKVRKEYPFPEDLVCSTPQKWIL